LTYTIKPNIYGGFACRIFNIPHIANITGLGTAIENGGLLQKFLLMLYKSGLKKAACVFFQNESNKKYFEKNNIVMTKVVLLPGSGVNLTQHSFEEYPDDSDGVRFLYIGRIMKDKGINELLEAIVIVKKAYPNVHFDIVGPCEEDYEIKLLEMDSQGLLSYYGEQESVHGFLKNAHALINPSYHEGMSNVLLEAAATGRPVLASNIPGCRETFEEAVSGFGFEAKSAESIKNTIIKFIELPYKRKKNMGLAARGKMEKEFDRTIVVDAYMQEIGKVMESRVCDGLS
jgi:galacturonosyltransferase